MPKVKIGLLSLLAVLALSAAASATASANTHQWIIENTPLSEKATLEIQGNNLPYAQEGQFETTLLGSAVHIYCQTAILPSGKNNLLTGGGANGTVTVFVEFYGCADFTVNKKGVSEPLPACKLSKEPIETTVLEGELEKAGVLTLKPKAGEPFATFSQVKTNKEATCVIEATIKVEGIQVCVIPHYGVALYVHVLECTPGGSSLLAVVGAIKEPANLYLGTGITLEKGGKFWST